MWRYEVAFINEKGVYQWKGFGYRDKFDRYLNRLVRKGIRIVGIFCGDGKEIENQYKAMYMA